MTDAALIVEADADVRRVIAAGLRRHGVAVRVADTGPAAVALLAADPGGVGAVVAGELVPGLDGVELAAALSAVRPGLPVFYFVGDSVPPDLLTLPGVELFLKPHGLLNLCRAVADRLAAATA